MLLSLLYVLFMGNLFVFDKDTNSQLISIHTHQGIFIEQQLSVPSSINTDKKHEQRSANESKETNTRLLDKNKNDFGVLKSSFFVLLCQYFNTKTYNTRGFLLPLPIYLYWCKILV